MSGLDNAMHSLIFSTSYNDVHSAYNFMIRCKIDCHFVSSSTSTMFHIQGIYAYGLLI